MAKELIPFNNMWHISGSTNVYHLVGVSGGVLLLRDINADDEKVERVSFKKAARLKDVSIDGVSVSDAMDKLYELEMTDEVPAPDELNQMKKLAEKLGYEITPIALSKIVQIYYNIMELADEFDIPDPYDNLTNNEI